MGETDREFLLRILCECGWIIKKHSYDNTIYTMEDTWSGDRLSIKFTNGEDVLSITVEQDHNN